LTHFLFFASIDDKFLGLSLNSGEPSNSIAQMILEAGSKLRAGASNRCYVTQVRKRFERCQVSRGRDAKIAGESDYQSLSVAPPPCPGILISSLRV